MLLPGTIRVKWIIPAGVAIFLLFMGCRHEPVFPNPGPSNNNNTTTSATCSPDTVYFTSSVLPLIISNCAISGCHDQTTHEKGLVLNNYSEIMKIVKSGNPSESKLYKLITATSLSDIMPPPPHQALTASNISAIQKWILQGAKNNQCTTTCDTAAFTFSGAVSPVINTNCKGCHNPASAGGGIDLSTYNNIKQAAMNGRLSGSIKHSPGFKPMPQGGNKLSDCQITQIEKWILSGMPNN